MKLLDPYFGALSNAEIANGINAASSNARRLREDAEVLFAGGSFASAAALAVLSIEEAGKPRVLRELALARNPEELKRAWKEFRRHTSKNTHWILIDLFNKGARRLQDFFPMYQEGAEHPELLDAVKQVALYVDCLGKKNWSIPNSVIDQNLAKTLLFIAKIFTGSRRLVSEREIELWVFYVQPHLHSPDAEAHKKALIAWGKAMDEEGLSVGTADKMAEFVGPGIQPPKRWAKD